ncbi:putative serine/threonine-protein kinase PIX7 [Heracleum sosnowskyi]|uniref:Serine/threonine-protein kinase PIX7 n=1 Tax=Heracleum sosnowskyi TaxID=360622 RepID=A0AAD8IMJ5_9APIA|nr:putative serine/threonine-protein kinase PIX7 [Heracleum sosnowskyi]
MKRFVAFLTIAQTKSAKKEAKAARSSGVLEAILKSSKLKSYTFNDLSVATRNFHPDSVIGEGAFGRVYKGWVDGNTFAAAKWGTGLVITIKRYNNEVPEADNAWLFKTLSANSLPPPNIVINSVGKLCHPNIVKLIGYCKDKKHRLLVYEYMPQGSLDTHLFRKDSEFQPLSWKLRISIALGAARALAYLHSPETNVIHRDVKTANLLIDSKYNAKLSGFECARAGPIDETFVTTLVKGTFGYLDPEYFYSGQVRMKSDVYSFGVVLLEILTGRKAIDMNLPEVDRVLFSWVESRLSKEHVISDIMDADIEGQYTEGAAEEAFSLAFKCTSRDSKSRPDAKQVVEELEQLLASVN